MLMSFPVLRCVYVQFFCAVLMMTGLAHGRTLSGNPKPRVCDSDDFLQLQETCRKENEDLLSAEKTSDDGMLCKKLVDLFYCVAGHVPLCFDNMITIYKSYFHSPHHCALSPQQIQSLQNLTTHTAHNQGDRDDQVDMEVDIIIPVSTPSPGDYSSEEEEDKEREEEDGGKGMRHEEQSGSDEHTDNGASVLSHCTIPLVVMSWLGAWRMTSYLLLS